VERSPLKARAFQNTVPQQQRKKFNNTCKNGFAKKEKRALYKNKSVNAQKEKGKRDTPKKRPISERGGE
jgi:hypothetical protein